MVGAITNPYEEILKAKRSVDKLFESMNVEPDLSDVRMPILEISDEKTEILVVIELPGIKKDELSVEVSENSLTIKAERGEESEEKKKNYYYSERQYSTFFRNIPLPEEVDSDTAKAKFREGILELRIKKAAKKKNVKQVKVE